MSIKSKKIRGIICILVFSIFALMGCGESTDSTSTISNSESQSAKEEKVKEFYKVNETAKLNNLEMTITKVNKSSGSEFDKPKKNMEFVIVTVKIKNRGKDKLSYNPFYFKMKNSKGQINDSTISTVDQDTQLQAGELAENGEVQGTVIFEEPVNDNGLELQYQDNAFSDKVKLNFKLN